MKFISIGYGNVVASDRVVALVSPDSAPIKIQAPNERKYSARHRRFGERKDSPSKPYPAQQSTVAYPKQRIAAQKNHSAQPPSTTE